MNFSWVKVLHVRIIAGGKGSWESVVARVMVRKSLAFGGRLLDIISLSREREVLMLSLVSYRT